MNIDPKFLKIFLLTLIFMLLMSVAAIISKAEEPRFKGGIDTAYIRGLWQNCFNASVSRGMPPNLSVAFCDCMTDTIREKHTRLELEKMTDRVEVFSGYANECGYRLFGSPTPLAQRIAQVGRFPEV